MKKDFLDEKPNSDVFIPKSITDLQSILDNVLYINEVPEIGILSADEYYLMDGFWETLGAKERNTYTWEKDIYEGEGRVPDWNLPYTQVLYANIVLEELDKGTVTNATQRELNEIQGAALFIRGFAFFNIAQHFADIFDDPEKNAPGIPIRLNPEIDKPSERASLKDSYAQIIGDLSLAARLLPDSLPFRNRNRPCKAAAYAALARIHLSMRAYEKAGLYADSCLQYYSRLIDYNDVDKDAFLPFSQYNDETIYQANILSTSSVLIGVSSPGCVIDSLLYDSYETNDLRKPIFFISNGFGLPNIKGGYSGSIVTFGGLAVDEIMFIRAECLAREGKFHEGLNILNTLLRKRFVTNTYVDKVANSWKAALEIILIERKKELVFRGVRWTDLKRLNKEGANTNLERKLNGTVHVLKSNDPKYILPIPPDVIALSGMEQNKR